MMANGVPNCFYSHKIHDSLVLCLSYKRHISSRICFCYWSGCIVSERTCVSSGAFGGHAAGLPPLENHALVIICILLFAAKGDGITSAQ